jgi:hypothetical protein
MVATSGWAGHLRKGAEGVSEVAEEIVPWQRPEGPSLSLESDIMYLRAMSCITGG